MLRITSRALASHIAAGALSTATAALCLMTAPAAALPPAECVVADNGLGTADLPPSSCGYVSLQPLMIIDGLPPGTTIECQSIGDSFFDITYLVGGMFGGQIQQFSAHLSMNLEGTGALATMVRPAFFDIFCETNSGPTVPGAPVQSFPHEWMALQGQLPPGDPDFDLLRITAGTNFGLPSPGHTTLTRRPDTTFNVDSFFDITYRIDFVGHPGGPLGGMSGSTTGTIRLQCGISAPVAVERSTWGAMKEMYR